MKENKKILIIHDRFKFKGGAERLVLIMAQGLGADIATEYWNEDESFSKEEVDGKIIIIGKQIKHTGLSYFSAQWRFFWQTKFIKDYDIIIFSGNNCLSSAWRARGKRKIMYCHTPVRYAYDLKNYYLKQKSWWKKPLFLFFVFVARVIYKWGIKKMDVVLCNSKNVQNRLQKYCNTESKVVYPPIISFCHSERGTSEESICKSIELDPSLRSVSLHSTQDDKKTNNYYLSFGRLDKLKRIDDVVKTFQKLPNKKLVIASGGPELENIREMTEGHPAQAYGGAGKNIQVLGFVSDEKLAELVSNCIANIYIPVDEDFGMSPLEAGAAGKPTIGVDDGGLKETIVHEKTGYLIPVDYKISDLIKAVRWMTPEKAESMKNNCVKQAEKFSKEKFVESVKNVL
ncbi:MAG: glycosyltransferase [Candidatus Falkowbacteria bacterium]